MKRNLLLGLVLSAVAFPGTAESPYHGSEAAEGKFYLYQVESGTWLQPNIVNDSGDDFSYRGSLGAVGFDIELKKQDGFSANGFKILTNFENNGELRRSAANKFWLNDGANTEWIFEPVEGQTNVYTIRLSDNTYLGYNSGMLNGTRLLYGGLSDNPVDGRNWQLVTREERLEKMQSDVETSGQPVDATWLIPWNDRGHKNNRQSLWTREGNAIDINISGFLNSYPVVRCSNNQTMNEYTTLTELPSGVYEFTVQAFYRDADWSDALTQRFVNGTDELRAEYYAGSASAKVMSIYKDGHATRVDNTFTKEVAGKWLPGSHTDAARSFRDYNAYMNDYIEATVTDGTLKIGLSKIDNNTPNDWLIYKRFYLRYVSTEIPDNIAPLQQLLTDLLAEAESLPSTKYLADAADNARDKLENSTDYAELNEAVTRLNEAIGVIKAAQADINNFIAVTEFFTDEEATAQFEAAISTAGYSQALRTLRYARRLAAADTHEDEFDGNTPAEGKFYLYNVGRKMFLEGGSDWGAHAALGFQGQELTFEDKGNGQFIIKTGLFNDGHDQLSHSGYMDGVFRDSETYIFIPADGADGVYYMAHGNNDQKYTMWDPYGRTDQGNNTELNVCTESASEAALGNPDAMWKLVTLKERTDLLANATEKNPVDATVYISAPGFNQRANLEAWKMEGGFYINQRGTNHSDFICEVYEGGTAARLSQTITGLRAGTYQVTVQGGYRHSNSDNVIKDPKENWVRHAHLFAMTETAASDAPAAFAAEEENTVTSPLPNMLDESGKCPGEGTKKDGGFEFPNSSFEAPCFYRAGLYKTEPVTITVGEGQNLIIGISKSDANTGDMIFVDNFRLSYLGDKDTSKSTDTIAPAGDASEGPVYNLQGIEVKNPTVPGIYIRNGKKFVVTK